MRPFVGTSIAATALAIVLCLPAYSWTLQGKSDDGYIPSFEIKTNDLKLSRLAQPNQYFDKIGRRAGVMGSESGQFEMWVWPWKVLRNFELQFFLETSTRPILARDIVRTVDVTPEMTTLTYTYESFTVREHILIPRREPGALLLLEVHTTMPLAIVPGFIPVVQPMWPAGIGGQYSYWDDSSKAYVISEGRQRALFLCGSPAGTPMAAPPAHMFADNPLQFRIDIKPGSTDGRFIPIVIAGGPVDSLTHKMHMNPVKEIYTHLWTDAQKHYNENYGYYQTLRSSTLQIATPVKELNLACEWGKVALDNLMVENPTLGYGMVAGFGLSGGGARPGFAWFFGGDAFINSLAMNSLGMFQQSRDALAFTQQWQRQEGFPIRKKGMNDPPVDVGKMAHELSQSDGLCDWWNEYHYGYNHADTSPWYIVAMGDYVRTSGDTTFLRESWTSVKQAFTWCLSKDSDGDGLMDLKGAGLGALEFGKLVGIYADVYTCGIFVQAIKEMKSMADLMGDDQQSQQADAQLKKAQPRLEELFWLDKEGFYAYGATDKGDQVHEKTPWSGVAMMFGLLDEERTNKSIEAFNSADLCTDWGVRTLSNRSELFEPTNYNYGAVWPFIASFFNTAQFRHHYALSGYQILESNIRHVFDHALGVVPEVFSGELNEKLGEAYHHQGFSTTGYILPLVRGLLGLEVDALKKTVTFVPHVPYGWRSVGYSGLRVGESTDGEIAAFLDSGVVIRNAGGDGGVKLNFRPAFPEGTTGILVGSPTDRAGGSRLLLENCGQDLHPGETLAGKSVSLSPGPSVFMFPESTVAGSANGNLKILSQNFTGKTLRIELEGRSGKAYTLGFDHGKSNEIENVDGAEVEISSMKILFPVRPTKEFLRKEIVIHFK